MNLCKYPQKGVYSLLFIKILWGFNMSLAFKDFANSSAMKLAMAVAVSFGAAANANATPPAIGQCAPAETVKAELVKAGYNNYFVYDVELLSETSPKPVWVRESIYAKDGLKDGYYVGRGGKTNELLCIHAQANDIILGDAEQQSKAQAIDPRFLQNFPAAATGINAVIKQSAEKAGNYPAIQMKITQANGGKGYVTISVNPSNHIGSQIFSGLAGEFGDINTGLIAGAEPYTGYTPAALSVLKQSRRVDAGTNAPIMTAALK